MEHFYALILAGGGGTRLWPMSRNDKPKQLLPLVDDHSMFQEAVTRLSPLMQPEQIYVVTGQKYLDAMRADAPQIPPQNFIAEPHGRDSAPAVALAMTVIHQRDPQAVVAMLTADHHITRKDAFRQVLAAAHDIAREGRIVTLGINPTFPATGFGYIKQGVHLGQANGFDYHDAERFTEKPDIVKATRFLASGKYSWNSGMFIWSAARAMDEFEHQQPKMFEIMQALASSVDTPAFQAELERLWPDMPKISIDFAIMEGAKSMAVIPIDIGWSDVGSWASLFDLLDRDKLGNAVRGKRAESQVMLDTRNTLVFTDRLAVAIGIEDVIVVETEDVLMICHKDRTQDVKQIVQYLKENGSEEYL